MKNITIAIFLILISNAKGFAQSMSVCGPAHLDTAAYRLAMEYSRNSARPLLNIPKTIRVFFHVLKSDDGSLRTTSPDSIAREFEQLVSAYSADNICFVNAGVDFINNSKLNTGFVVGTDAPSLFDPYRVSGCINIFYVNRINGNNPSCPGGCGFGGITMGGVPNTFCLVAAGNINDATPSVGSARGVRNTVAHEVGHCFGLLHTFDDDGHGFENINGSNGSSSADLIWDTNADPYNYPSTCNSSTFCNVYSGTCTDPNGSNSFNPPYNNIMSYWCIVSGVQILTQGQFDRIDGFLNTYQPLINCISPENATEGPYNLNNGFKIVTANSTITTNSNINITGNSYLLYGADRVDLKNGFKSTPAGNGKTIIRAKRCN